MQLLRRNFSTHLILAGWPLSVAVVISIAWSKELYLDYALVANAGYLLASLLDWGGVNARVLLNKSENIENIWLNKVIFFSVSAIILGIFLSNVEIVLFAVAAFTNPQWIYVYYSDQNKYNRVLILSRIILLFTFLSPNFLILLPIGLIATNVLLILMIVNQKLRLSRISEIQQYFIQGFSFFMSKLSTSLWMFLPLLIISRVSTYEYLAYIDKLYQMTVAASVPIVLTQFKGQLNLSRSKFTIVSQLLLLTFLTICTLKVFYSLDFSFLYIMFGTSLFFLAVFGQGWIRQASVNALNNVYSISTLAILALGYFFPETLLLYPIFFIINVYARARYY